jgi:pimeloyl-ACP methyl ester carboxylesterase
MRHLAGLFPNGRLTQVPGVAGFVQHEAPAECAALWREFVRSVTV